MNRTTGIAVGVFALLLVGVLVTRQGEPERGIQRVSFTSLDEDAVDAVEVTGPNPVKLVKRDGGWIVDGVDKDADATVIERSIDQVVKLNSSDLITASEERYEELGVSDENGVKVVVSTNGSPAAELVVGNGASGGSYVRVDDQVFAVKGIYKSTFDREPDSWLDRRLFRGRAADEVSKVEVSTAEGQSFSLIKADGVWSLPDDFNAPEAFRFDKNAARNLASTLVNLRAREIVLDGVVGDTGLGEGADAIVLHFEEGENGGEETVSLRLGAEVPADEDAKAPDQVYAMVDTRSDEIVTLLSSQATRLRRGLDAVRNMKVMDFDPEKAVALSVRGEERVDLEKKDGEWVIASHSGKKPDDFEFDPASAMRRVRALLNARAAKVLPEMSPAAAGLSQPRASVTVTLEDGSTARLAFGSQFVDENERAHVYVGGNADELVYAATEWLETNTTKGLEGFQKAPAPPGGALSGLDPSALQNLPPDVRKSLQQQMAQQAQQQELMKKLQQRGE